MRIRTLSLWVLLASCSEPPPPPPPPPTPAQRLDKGVEKLRKLAEEQLAAAPTDARLQLWVAAFKGEAGLDGLPNAPLTALVRASRAPHDEAAVKAVEETLPGSSHASLVRARWILRNARGNPEYWKAATEAVEEALKRNQWDCPVRAFELWAFDWLEKHEPDALVRACFRHRYANESRRAAPEFLEVARGMAEAAGPPRLDAARVAKAARRLIEERLLASPDARDVLLGHAQHPPALEAQFLVAWRAKDLETARSASLAVEDYGRRDAAVSALKSAARGGLDDTMAAVFREGVLKPPFPAGVELRKSAGEDADWRKEVLKEIDAGAKSHVAALKAAAARSTSHLPEIDAKRPARSPFVNLLGQALRDRDFLFTDAYPKDRHDGLLDAAFRDRQDPGAVGGNAYAWVLLDNLHRPATIPSKLLARRFSKPEEPAPGKDLDLQTILLARKEGSERDPSPVKARDEGMSLFGYALRIRDAAKAKPADVVPWLPEPKTPEVSRVEVLVAETLRAATEKDFGPDWARWKDVLGAGR